jgi:hypothetical protein
MFKKRIKNVQTGHEACSKSMKTGIVMLRNRLADITDRRCQLLKNSKNAVFFYFCGGKWWKVEEIV